MLASSIPARFALPFASGAGAGYIRPIPQASQIGITNGAASLTDGFPPLTFTATSAGGVPPFGQDFNGLLNQITLWNQWQAAGAPTFYNSAFSASVGGYPNQAVVAAAALGGNFWMSTVDNNTSDPDTGGANWVGFNPIGITANTTYYVNNSTGSDNNNGLATGTAWATLTHAIAALRALNFNGYTVTLQLANTGVAYPFSGVISGITSGGLAILGNASAPTSYVISGTGVTVQSSIVSFTGLTIQNTGASNNSLYATQGAAVTLSAVDFTNTTTGGSNAALLAAGNGGSVLLTGSCSWGGSTGYMWAAFQGGSIAMEASQVVANTPAFSTAAVNAAQCGTVSVSSGATWSGTAATGSRYNAALNGVISNTGSASFFPGNAVGSTATGGQYT